MSAQKSTLTDKLIQVRTVPSVRRVLDNMRRAKGSIGFVPTMGALHEGHLSLIRRSAAQNDFTVVSIFVNPTQFAPSEDLKRYPRPLKRDIALAAGAGADLAFVPSVSVMYPDGFCTTVTVEGLTGTLCGASRPTHFAGVTTVVTKLFNIVAPDRAYFGQKDAQQASVIRRMVCDLDIPVKIVVCPTVREPDGLAMSSRNAYLSAADRAQAPILHESLQAAKALVKHGQRDAARIKRFIKDMLRKAGRARIDYVEVVDADSLQPVKRLKGRCLLALAVYFGKTRLIDNEPINVK